MPDDIATDPNGEPSEAERAADEAARVADPFRWQLARMNRGDAAQRFVDHLAARTKPSNSNPTNAA